MPGRLTQRDRWWYGLSLAYDRHKRGDNRGVELSCSVTTQFGYCSGCGSCLPIWPVSRHCAESVAGEDDSRDERNLFCPEAVRIATAVVSLVTRAHDRTDLAENAANRFEHLLSPDGVLLDQVPLGVVEGT